MTIGIDVSSSPDKWSKLSSLRVSSPVINSTVSFEYGVTSNVHCFCPQHLHTANKQYSI